MSAKPGVTATAGTTSDERFFRACHHWDRGELGRAFRIFLAAAKDGDGGAQLNLAYFYDEGIGVRRNRSKAFYWYKRAYQKGEASAAVNIGIVLLGERQTARALQWFQRALRAGDEDAALHIGQLLLREYKDVTGALKYLEQASVSDKVTIATRDKARRLLKHLAKSLPGKKV